MNTINTDKVYDAKYCARINAKLWRFQTIPSAMKILYDHFKPNSVIDIGCANGVHLKAFKKLGVQRLFGIEGTKHWAPYIEKNHGENYKILDLRNPFDGSLDQFELVMCLEVLEHLEKQYAKQAVKNILSLGKTFCISACPISGGFHHFNPQPREYWIRVFGKLGAEYCKEESEELQESFGNIRCSGWFKNSLKIFRIKTV